MAERTLGSSIFAAGHATSQGRGSLEVLAYPLGNFPNSDNMASKWRGKWDVWQVNTLDLYPGYKNPDELSEKNVEEVFPIPVVDIGRREC